MAEADTPWYPVTNQYPRKDVRVRVQWSGRVFEAARTDRGWLTIVNRQPVTLPMPRQRAADVSQPWRGWHGLDGHQPSAWQPLSAEAWKAPLPEPLPTVACRMVSERTRFQAVEDATAEELAREMEADRETARVSRENRETSSPETAWWRDIYRIAYEPVGAITPRMAEGRLMRALCYDATLRMDLLPYRTNAAVMADLKRGMEALHGDPTSDWRPPFKPTAEDLADYLVAMDWWRKYVWEVAERESEIKAVDDRLILAGRLLDPPISWSEIGHRLGRRHHESIRTRYKRIVASITAIANSTRVHPLDRLLDDVRDGNRKARLRA